MTQGTLREQLLYPTWKLAEPTEEDISDIKLGPDARRLPSNKQLEDALKSVKLGHLLSRSSSGNGNGAL